MLRFSYLTGSSSRHSPSDFPGSGGVAPPPNTNPNAPKAPSEESPSTPPINRPNTLRSINNLRVGAIQHAGTVRAGHSAQLERATRNFLQLMYVKRNCELIGWDRPGWSAVYSASNANAPIPASRIRLALPLCTSTRRAKQTSKSSGWLPVFSYAVRQIRSVLGAAALQWRSPRPAGRSLFPGNHADDTGAPHTAAAPSPAHPRIDTPPFPVPEKACVPGRLLRLAHPQARAASSNPANRAQATQCLRSPATIHLFSIRRATICSRQSRALASLQSPAPAAARSRSDLPGRGPGCSPA